MIRNLILILLTLIVGCSNQSGKERILITSHFKIFYTLLDDKNIQEIADSLEAGYPKITSHLQPGDMPIAKIQFYTNSVELNKANPGMPVWAIGQATSDSTIYIISPNDPKQDYQTMIRNIKHEFAHCVSMKINPTISNNPRWLWETIALYEANFPWDPKMLDYLVKQKPPSLNELNQISNTLIYEVGYFIGQFIEETKGPGMFKTLILNNGNLRDTFNMNDEEFTKAWFEFVKEKYGI